MDPVKVAVITGGASGIGLAVATALVEKQGWHIHLFDRNDEAGLAARKSLGPGLEFHKVDVVDWEALSATFRDVFAAEKRLDFVFGNAGIIEHFDFCAQHPIEQALPKPDMSVLDVNLRAVLMTSYLALHYLRHSPPGDKSIVLTASSTALYAAPSSPLYTGTKHGVLGFMRSIAGRLVSEGIRVNAILPGPVQTGLLDKEMWEALFPPDTFTSTEFVADRVLQLVDGSAMSDFNDTHIESGMVYGRALEISAGKIYFREQLEYCDDEMARSLVALVPSGE